MKNSPQLRGSIASRLHGRQRGGCQHRRAASVVELAVCLPVIMLLVIGSIEGANVIFVRQSAVQAAYEVAKTSVRRGSGVAEGIQLGQQVLAARQIQPTSITVTPNNVEDLRPGTPVTARVVVPGSAKSIISFPVFQGITIDVQATMVKE